MHIYGKKRKSNPFNNLITSYVGIFSLKLLTQKGIRKQHRRAQQSKKLQSLQIFNNNNNNKQGTSNYRIYYLYFHI